MDDSRLAKQVFLWDKSLNDKKILSTWSNEVKSIFDNCNLNIDFNFNVKQVVSSMKKEFIIQQNKFLELECQEKPKLRTFILFKDFNLEPAYITKPLTFFQRRMISKIRLGCLPIRLETGRYSIPRLPESKRTCLVCKDLLTDIQPDSELDPIESEYHYLFDCLAYRTECETWLGKMTLPPDFNLLDLNYKLKIVLNDPCNVKSTAQFITHAYNIRSKILN